MIRLVREMEPDVDIKWDTRDAILFYVPGISKSWARFRTKDESGLDCRFVGRPGQFNLSRIERFGTLPNGMRVLAISCVTNMAAGILGLGNAATPLTDRMVMIVCTVGLSISILVYIIVFQYFFAYKLGWFPVQGWGNSFWENLFRYASLPILIGLAVSIAPSLRLYRTFVLDEINQDYVRTARAKGLGDGRVLFLHALRNAAIPIVTLLGLQFAQLLGGAVVTETIFAWPGVGRLVVEAIFNRDFPVVQGVVLVVSLIFVAVNLLVDLAYVALDPRIRTEAA